MEVDVRTQVETKILGLLVSRPGLEMLDYTLYFFGMQQTTFTNIYWFCKPVL